MAVWPSRRGTGSCMSRCPSTQQGTSSQADTPRQRRCRRCHTVRTPCPAASAGTPCTFRCSTRRDCSKSRRPEMLGTSACSCRTGSCSGKPCTARRSRSQLPPTRSTCMSRQLGCTFRVHSTGSAAGRRTSFRTARRRSQARTCICPFRQGPRRTSPGLAHTAGTAGCTAGRTAAVRTPRNFQMSSMPCSSRGIRKRQSASMTRIRT